MLKRQSTRCFLLTFTLMIVMCNAFAGDALGQSGLRESLERLDRNRNGEIDPEEITPLSRPFFEMLSNSGSTKTRLRLDRPNSIERLQEISREYHALKHGKQGRKNVHPDREGKSTVLSFGPEAWEPKVPEFGLAKMRFPYNQDDLDFVERTMKSHDENKDGFIDRDEASRHRWTHRNPFDDDLNKDDKLSWLEMAQRYARRRMLNSNSEELRKQYERTGGSEIRPSTEKEQREDRSQWWRKGGKDFWLTAALMGRYDRNRNGVLERSEAEATGLPVAIIDLDNDAEVTRDELFAHIRREQEKNAGPETGVPDWFYEHDANGDRQVAMHEYTQEWTDEKVAEFTMLDVNDDGLLTESEIASPVQSEGRYESLQAEVIPPKKTIVSEIVIEDDFLVADVDVQISISHSNVSLLDGFLTGPGGQRIELFSAVGAPDDHFDQTIFDDQAETPVTQGRPPFHGSFRTEGAEKGQAGLDHFNGKSAKGTWGLVIRGTRSDRFGVLHGWKLLVRKQP